MTKSRYLQQISKDQLSKLNALGCNTEYITYMAEALQWLRYHKNVDSSVDLRTSSDYMRFYYSFRRSYINTNYLIKQYWHHFEEYDSYYEAEEELLNNILEYLMELKEEK